MDLARDGGAPYRGARTIMTLGHDEYWTNSQFTAVKTLRDQGTNYLAVGGNTLWWRIRFDAAYREFEIYKSAGEDPVKDGSLATVNFRGGEARPLLGSQYICYGINAPMVVLDPTMFLFAGTGAVKGSSYAGLLRIEIDAAAPTPLNPPNLSIVARSPVQCRGQLLHGDLTYYTVPSGAGVINMGTMGFAVAFDEVNRGQYPMLQSSIHFARKVYANALLEASKGPLGRRHKPSGNAARIISDTKLPRIDPKDDPGIPAPPVLVPGSGKLGDMTLEGRADILAMTREGRMLMYATRPNLSLAPGRLTGTGWQIMNWLSVVPDMNQDGQSELLARHTDGTLWLYRGLGEGHFASPSQVGRGWGGMDTMTVVPDISGDGLPELVGREKSGALVRYRLTGEKTWLTGRTQIGRGWGSMTHVIALNDFTGDKRPDIVALRNDGTLWVYQFRKGVLVTVRKAGHGWSGFKSVTNAGDLDMDGREDLVGISSRLELRHYPNLGMRFGASRVIGRNWGAISMLA